MPRGAPTHTSSDPLLLGLLGLGAAGLVVLSVLARGSRPAILVSSTPAPVEGARVATALPMSGEREPVPAHERSATAGEPEVVSASTQAGGKAPRKEREFLQDFLALERARPGALAERAGELLAGGGPSAKKVALLRALGESGSKEHLRWLEHAVRAMPDDSGPHGVSVAHYALGELVAAASTKPEARPALRRLAFEARDLASGLRRSAALGLARSGDEAELGELRVILAREDDELLVAGVLAALSERPDSRQAARVLAELASSKQDLPTGD